ncbi:MAG TPA: hypothetical protein VGR20_14990, partial [Acidimicrobiia bacterium]|nr:hypothetical protein [Acidimicrobiia bacterium]
MTMALPALVGVPSAQASSVDRQAWSRTGPSPLPTFTADGAHVYVAATAGAEEARTFVDLDTSNVAADQLVGAALVLTEDDGGLLPENAAVAACALAGPLAASGELPAAQAPLADCRLRVDATRQEGRWTVPLHVFASLWSAGTGPTGLVLVPVAATPASTWRLAFAVDGTALTVAGPPPGEPAVQPAPLAPGPGPDTTARPPTAPSVPTPDPVPATGYPRVAGGPQALTEPVNSGYGTEPQVALPASLNPPVEQPSVGGPSPAPPRHRRESDIPSAPRVFGLLALIAALLFAAGARSRRRTARATAAGEAVPPPSA